MPLDLDHLKAFLVVVEEGSITRAASRLLVAQPALGRQMRLLEESLGAKLLARSPTGVQPTAAGRELLVHARDILREVSRAEAAIAPYGQQAEGEVVVALPTSLVDLLAPRLFRSVRHAFPLIRMVMREGDSHVVQEWLRDAKVDLGLLPDSCSDTSLHVGAGTTQVLCFCGRPDLIPGGLRPIPLSEALTYPLAMSMKPNRLRRLVDDAARTLGLSVQPAVECSSGHMLSLLARDGMAFSIQPWVGPAPVVVDGLAVLPIIEPSIARTLAVVWSTTRTLSLAADEVRQVLERIITELPDA